MSSKRAVVVAVASFIVGAGILACSSDESRPPAASSGGSFNGNSSGAGSSSGGGPSDGSAPVDGSTSSTSSGGSSGTSSSGSSGTVIQTGLRAIVDGVLVSYETTPKAVKAGQVTGSVIEISGSDAATNGNKIVVTLTASSGLVAAGLYACNGANASMNYGTVAYTVAGGETMNAQAVGECSITVKTVDITVIEGTFSATVKGASTTKSITNGEFRLNF